ncbi:MAG: 50S ribosomal protein L32 [Candidatus Muiribacteriota bacterium]|jgi:large subunit ribosomal protein L32
MPNPVSRHSKSRRDKRRASNWKADMASNLATCSNKDCGQPVMPHKVCPACGFYKGKNIIKVKE